MKQTKFMQVMFSAVENGDEELTSQVANDIEDAKAEGNVETDEVSYNNLGNGKVLVIDKVNGEATIAEMPEDEAATYDLEAVPDEELDKFLYPAEDGVTPNEGVQDFQVDDEYAPFDDAQRPNVEINAEGEDIDQDDQMGEQHQFSVSTDNEVVLRIFSDVEFYDRIFSETLESDETSIVGDLKVEKLDDDTVVVTSEATGDQAKVTMDGDEMEVTELDQKEMSYSDIDDLEPALYSVVMNEDEFALAQYLFGEGDEECEEGECEDDLEDVGEDEGPEAYNPLYVVGIDADNHNIVDSPVYAEEDAQELAEHLSEIGVDGVNIFDDPSDARDYADQLLHGVGGIAETELEAHAEPEEHEFSDYTLYTTRYYTADELEETTDFMERCYAENAETDKIEDAISNGDQVETDNEVITPVDDETAVVEDKNTGEYTKATLDEDGSIDMEAIDEDEASDLTDNVTTDKPEDEDDEDSGDEKEYSVTDEFEFVTRFGMKLYSDDSDANDDVEDAIESGEEVETDEEVITPISDNTAVVEDKENGEYTKVTIDEDGGKDVEAISEEEAKKLFSFVEVEPTDEETTLATATRFFADAMAPQQQMQAVPVQQQAPMQQGENPDPNAIPVDENGNPIDPSMVEGAQDPAAQSVEAIEDKALVAVQSIQAAANDAVMAIQQAKEAPAPGQQEDLQEAQFSDYYYDDEDERMYADTDEYVDTEDTLTNWLLNK